METVIQNAEKVTKLGLWSPLSSIAKERSRVYLRQERHPIHLQIFQDNFLYRIKNIDLKNSNNKQVVL